MLPKPVPRQASLHWRQIEGRPTTVKYDTNATTEIITPPPPPPPGDKISRFSKVWNGSDDTWDLSVYGVATISQVLLLTRSGRALTETLDFTFSGAIVQMINRDDASHLIPPNGEESDAVVVY